MYRILSRFETGTLCEWHECTGCESPMEPGDPASARLWLSGFLSDGAQAVKLRLSAHAAGDGLGLAQRSGHVVVDQLAHLIGSGRLRVCHRQTTIDNGISILVDAPPPPPSEAREPVVSRSSAPVAAPPPEPSTLPAAVDGAAMAQVLQSAAADGVPFCEVCEKARNERERSTSEAAA